MSDAESMAVEAQVGTVPVASPTASATVPDLVGVKGWLLFFCISLTIISPLATLFNVSAGFLASYEAFDRFPGLLVLVLADSAVSIAIMGLSVFAGISLWRRHAGAVRAARIFLIAGAVYALLAPFAPLLAGLPDTANAEILEMAPLAVSRGLLYFVIWMNYLQRSRRVRATFPDARYPGTAAKRW